MLTRPLARKLTRPLFGGAEEWVDPLADIPFVLRLQTHRGDDVPFGLYQDAAATIPATEDGHPVGAWKDELSGGGVVISQSNAASRPTLRFDSGVPVVDFDGVDDFVFGSLVSGTNDNTVTVCFRITGNDQGIAVNLGRAEQAAPGGGTRQFYTQPVSGVWAVGYWEGNWETTGVTIDPSGDSHVLSLSTELSSGESTIWKNLETPSVGTAPIPLTPTTSTVSLGGLPAFALGIIPQKMQVTALLIRDQISYQEEIERIHAYYSQIKP